MARIEKTFDDRAWFMIECDDPNCEQRFDDSQWYADEDDLLTDAKDEGWQIPYKDEHPELERTATPGCLGVRGGGGDLTVSGYRRSPFSDSLCIQKKRLQGRKHEVVELRHQRPAPIRKP